MTTLENILSGDYSKEEILDLVEKVANTERHLLQFQDLGGDDLALVEVSTTMDLSITLQTVQLDWEYWREHEDPTDIDGFIASSNEHRGYHKLERCFITDYIS